VGLARAADAVFAVDIDPARTALALQMGAGAAVLRFRGRNRRTGLHPGRGFDAVLICATHAPTTRSSWRAASARPGARVAIGAVGLTCRASCIREELTSWSRAPTSWRYDPAYEEGGRDYPPGYVR